MRRNLLLTWLMILAVWGFCANRASADVPGITMTGYGFTPANGTHFTLGYIFEVTQPITLTALGSIDFGGTSIAGTGARPVAVYYSAVPPQVGGTVYGHTSGDLVPGASAQVLASDPILGIDGGAYAGGDGFRYHTLASPITLDIGNYEIMTANLGTGYATNWTGIGNAPGVFGPDIGTFSNVPTDSASYGTDTVTFNIDESNIGGLLGPNFLVAVPEPSCVALLSLIGAGLVRTRRQIPRSTRPR